MDLIYIVIRSRRTTFRITKCHCSFTARFIVHKAKWLPISAKNILSDLELFLFSTSTITTSPSSAQISLNLVGTTGIIRLSHIACLTTCSIRCAECGRLLKILQLEGFFILGKKELLECSLNTQWKTEKWRMRSYSLRTDLLFVCVTIKHLKTNSQDSNPQMSVLWGV